MGKIASIKRAVARCLGSYVFWVLFALIVAFLIFNAFIARPKVGIIRVASIFLDPPQAAAVVKMLQYVEETDEIKALVLEIDSIGGAAVSAEEVYLYLVRLKQEKPVVAYVNIWSVSGGYYIAVPANFIYAKPTSLVGNVGVVASLPPEREEIEEDVMGSGPSKTATSRREVINWVEMAKESFLRAVISQRGDRLKISKEELAKATIYLGIEALKYGLIDEIGSGADAIKKAADLAGVRQYEVEDINKKLDLLPPWYEEWAFFKGRDLLEPETLKSPVDRLPMFYYLPQTEVRR